MDKSVFRYPDTNSARANIEMLNRKFKKQKIAIIGLGGTGSYILDLVAKTPVSEIHLYDDDQLLLHNAFRAPGALDGNILDSEIGLKKVDYYFDLYSRLHTGIVKHDKRLTEENMSELTDFTFAFVSIDSNAARSVITNGLLGIGIPFVDVGLGVNKADDCLIATLRVTIGSAQKNDHLSYRIGNEEWDGNEYATNIQIADLNCLNAVLAVIKWKKLLGFYQDLKGENNILYLLNTNKILNEDHTP
jgi:hypothetical protein